MAQRKRIKVQVSIPRAGEFTIEVPITAADCRYWTTSNPSKLALHETLLGRLRRRIKIVVPPNAHKLFDKPKAKKGRK